MKKHSKPYQIFRANFDESFLYDLFCSKISRARFAGRDGVDVSKFQQIVGPEINLISRKAKNGTYRFTRYREKLISKGPSSLPRVLSIPTVRDRITLRALCELLAEVYPNSVTRKPHEYIKEIKNVLKECGDNSHFCRIDVKDYYPSINHSILMGVLKGKIRKKEILSLIEKAISTPTIGCQENGIPQGLSVSNILANIYLTKMDEIFSEKFKYYRYVDDILVVCNSYADARKSFREITQTLKSERSLTCHELGTEGKSCITSVEDGIDYLGFRLSHGKIAVRKSSLNKMATNIVSTFSQFKDGANDPKFLWRLNIRITGCRLDGKNYGWLFFFLQMEEKSQLSMLDNIIKKQTHIRNKTHLLPKIKTFIKAYHEIRYNHKSTTYIPDFDKITVHEMAKILSDLTGKELEKIMKISHDEIESEFRKLIRREVKDLEKDTLELFS